MLQRNNGGGPTRFAVQSDMTHTFSYYMFDIGVAYKEDTDRVTEVVQSIADGARQTGNTKPAYSATCPDFRYPSKRFLYNSNALGPNDSSITAIPVAIPKLVTIGAQQSCRRRTIMWHGTTINNSRMLPRSSHETIRVVVCEEFLRYT